MRLLVCRWDDSIVFIQRIHRKLIVVVQNWMHWILRIPSMRIVQVHCDISWLTQTQKSPITQVWTIQDKHVWLLILPEVIIQTVEEVLRQFFNRIELQHVTIVFNQTPAWLHKLTSHRILVERLNNGASFRRYPSFRPNLVVRCVPLQQWGKTSWVIVVNTEQVVVAIKQFRWTNATISGRIIINTRYQLPILCIYQVTVILWFINQHGSWHTKIKVLSMQRLRRHSHRLLEVIKHVDELLIRNPGCIRINVGNRIPIAQNNTWIFMMIIK